MPGRAGARHELRGKHVQALALLGRTHQALVEGDVGAQRGDFLVALGQRVLQIAVGVAADLVRPAQRGFALAELAAGGTVAACQLLLRTAHARGWLSASAGAARRSAHCQAKRSETARARQPPTAACHRRDGPALHDLVTGRGMGHGGFRSVFLRGNRHGTPGDQMAAWQRAYTRHGWTAP